MEKIKVFKEKALAVKVDVMLDYYPGDPIYIGRESDEKTEEYLEKLSTEKNIKLPKTEGVFHYYTIYTSERRMESYYNNALFSIPNMTLDSLSFALKELEAYSYKELFEALDVLSSRFANEEVMCIDARHDVKRFKNIFNRQFKNKLPLSGRITSYFIGSMRKEMRLKEKYLEMLINKMKEMIAIKMENSKKVIQLTSLANTDSKILNDKFEGKKQEISNSVTNRSSTKKTPQLKTLFNFIDFLHANIDNFNEYDNTIQELKKKIERHSQLGTHYTEKSERDALEKEINEDLDVLLENIINPIKEKVAELELFDWELPRTFSDNYFELANRLCKSFNKKDLDAILKAKTQYIEFTIKISPRVIQQAQKVFEYLYETMIEIAINYQEEGDVSIKYEKVKRAESFEELVKGFKAREKLSKPHLSSSAATIDSHSAPTASFFETDFSETNTIELINTNTIKDINFERIFAAALAYEDDTSEMREFCIREQKKADRDYFYKKDLFYKKLLEVVVKVKEQVKFNQKPHPERKHVGSFFIAGGGGGRSYEYASVVLLEQIVNEMLNEDKSLQKSRLNTNSNNIIITARIKALFDLIDFLHSNINEFKNNDDVIKELEQLHNKVSNLGVIDNYKKRLKKIDLDKKIDNKLQIINANITEHIKAKALELEVCDWSYNRNIWNWSIADVENLKNKPINLKPEDIKNIQKHKNMYVEYRKATNNDYSTGVFFSDLDTTLYNLFSFFCENIEEELVQFKNAAYILNPKHIQSNNLVDKEEKQQLAHKLSVDSNKLNMTKQVEDEETLIPKPFYIPVHILEELEKQGFIEDFYADTITWLKNKQLLRELLMHKNIKKEKFSKGDVERATPNYFIHKGKPAVLANNKIIDSLERDNMLTILSQLEN